MTIPRIVSDWLGDQEKPYCAVYHASAVTSQEVAEAAGISGELVVKGVVVKDADGFLVALVPAAHMLHLRVLRRVAGRPFELAGEEEFRDLFPDCDPGAVPGLALAYGVPVLVAAELAERPLVYLESGDHRTLVEMQGKTLRELLPHAAFLALSGPAHVAA